MFGLSLAYLLHFTGAFRLTIGEADALSGKARLCLYANNSGDIQLGLFSSFEDIERERMNRSLWGMADSGGEMSTFCMCGLAIVMFTEVTEACEASTFTTLVVFDSSDSING